MAKAIGNEIIKSVSGRLGSIDRTIGRDGGQMLNFIKNGQFTILGKKPLMPQTKSAGRQARTTAYCNCDEKYKLLSAVCKINLQAYQIAFASRKEKTLTPFQYFIKLCLKNELCAFINWSGCQIPVTPPCPAPDLVGTTWVDAAYPDEIHYGWDHCGLYAQDTQEYEYVLIEFNNPIGNRTLHVFIDTEAAAGLPIRIYNVSPFDVKTVTWNTAPEKVSIVGEFVPVEHSWNAIDLTGAGKHISLNPYPNPEWFYTIVNTEFYTYENAAPYIT